MNDTNMFVVEARPAAVAWKTTTDLVPDEARVPGAYGDRPALYPFVFPSEYRWLNLLPAAREIARTRFEAAGIAWHGDGDGPNPHLLSSQVQCLNALAPLVDRPEDLARWLGAFLPVAEVLPFGAATRSPRDATDHVVFEWHGLSDYLGEWRGAEPVRGSLATSIDAAVRYRTPEGATELALIEWKYTESYPGGGPLKGSAAYQGQRFDRYRSLVFDPEGPINLQGGVQYEDLFAEPSYQLMREQLLAWRIEVAGELGVSRAVVVHVAPAANAALLADSLGKGSFERVARAAGGLIPGWRMLLRRPDRFVSVDASTVFDVCEPACRARYAHLVSSASGHAV